VYPVPVIGTRVWGSAPDSSNPDVIMTSGGQRLFNRA